MQLVKGRGRIITSLLIAVLLLSASVACSLRRGDSQSATDMALVSEAPMTGQATLLCSQECADRGQCGMAELGEMVLLNSTGPVTSDHDIASRVGTLVAIDHEESRPVIQSSTNEVMTVIYYLVAVPDRGQDGSRNGVWASRQREFVIVSVQE